MLSSTYVLAICTSPFENCLFSSFAIYSMGCWLFVGLVFELLVYSGYYTLARHIAGKDFSPIL
jgi:hypothetical protein